MTSFYIHGSSNLPIDTWITCCLSMIITYRTGFTKSIVMNWRSGETESARSASYLNTLPYFDAYDHLNIPLDDKYDYFNLHITIFPFLATVRPLLIIISWFCNSYVTPGMLKYDGFITRARRYAGKLLVQGYIQHRFKSAFRKSFGIIIYTIILL